MSLVRILLVVILTLSASVSGEVEAGHMPVAAHDHAAVDHAVDDQPLCCVDSSERAQTCHILSALLPTMGQDGADPTMVKAAYFTSGRLWIGIKLSGPLDPPRAV